MRSVAAALQVSRSGLSDAIKRSHKPPRKAKVCRPDEPLLTRIRSHIDQRPSYGYRRVTALLGREQEAPRVNHKRVYRVMRNHGLLLSKHAQRPLRTHEGQVVTLMSNRRFCSDGFEIRCWNGERVHVVFSLDCCDREAIAFRASARHPTSETIRDLMAETIEARFGPGCTHAPHPVEWLSDNGPPYVAHDTRVFGASSGLVVITTPAYSPESNGVAEAFVKTFKRDYVYLARLPNADAVLSQLEAWFEDYNEAHPHRGLGMKSPREFRRLGVAA